MVQLSADLEPGHAHFHAQAFGFFASRDRASVIVGEDDDRDSDKSRPEQPLTAHIEIVAVDECKHRASQLEMAGDGGRDDTPDFDGLRFLGNDVGDRGVCSDKAELAVLAVEVFHGEIVVHDGAHDLAMLRADRPVHQQNIAVVDAGAQHRYAARADHERGLRVPDEDVGEVHRPAVEILRRRWKPSLDRAFYPYQNH